MKRKVIVSITFVVLLCSIVLCVINQKKAPFIEGVIVEKNERFFTIETDIQEKIVCTLPKEYDYQDISLGDNIRVYYKGEILETSPARIKNVKEIKKILGIVAGVVGIISVIVGVALKMNNNAIAIIGGVDGPTSVFVAGKLNSVLVSILLIAIGVVMLIVAIIFYLKRKR